MSELKEHVKNLILDNYLKDKEIRRQKYKRCLAMAEACKHKRWYDADEVDKLLAELRENNKKAFKRDADNWNRLCVKYNKLIELKKDFCENFNDIVLESDK